MTDEDILNIFWRKNSTLKRLYNNHKVTIEQIDYLLNRFKNCCNIFESLYRIKYKIECVPKCPICGKEIKFNEKLNCYNQYCSKQCANKNPQLISKRKETCLEKYGYETPAKNKDVIDKIKTNWNDKTKEEIEDIQNSIKHTCIEKYGDENFKNIEKQKQTYKSKTDKEKQEIINKRKATLFIKYGDSNYINIEKQKETLSKRTKEEQEEINKKIKQTKQEHFGNPNYVNHEKAKLTIFAKYGVEYLSQSNEIKEKIKQNNLEKYGKEYTLQLSEIREKRNNKIEEITKSIVDTYNTKTEQEKQEIINKRRNTMLDKYGEISYSKTNKYKQHMSKIVSSKEFQTKKYFTEKLNGNLGKQSSNIEDKLYELILTKYNDCLHTYYSDDYPFKCDFYIPSKELYIEYNGHWTHGGKLYEGTAEDIVKLDLWKSKNTKFYNNAIYTWTDLDIRKHNIAKQNKLNYLVFYTKQELINWLNLLN